MLRNAAASMVAKLVASLKSMLSVIEHPKKELDNTSVTVESTIMCGMQGHKGNELFVHEPPMKYDDSLRTKVVDPVASVDRHDAEARAQRSAAVHGARKEESIVRSEITSQLVKLRHVRAHPLYPVLSFS